MSHRPVCVKCQVEMKPEKNDVAAVYNDGNMDHDIWLCDKWKCPTCGYEILSGFGLHAISAHFEDSFQRYLTTYSKPGQLIVRYHR